MCACDVGRSTVICNHGQIFGFHALGMATIKTHDSESRGQEETAIIRETKNTRPLSELFTRKSVHKTTNEEPANASLMAFAVFAPTPDKPSYLV